MWFQQFPTLFIVWNSKPVGMLLLLGTVPEEVEDSGERETSQLVVGCKVHMLLPMTFACTVHKKIWLKCLHITS